jgi:transposase
MDLTDEQWEAIRSHIPEPERQGTTERGGRPLRDPRDVLNGILWSCGRERRGMSVVCATE